VAAPPARTPIEGEDGLLERAPTADPDTTPPPVLGVLELELALALCGILKSPLLPSMAVLGWVGRCTFFAGAVGSLCCEPAMDFRVSIPDPRLKIDFVVRDRIVGMGHT
jgi:hypothetical protein